MGVIVAKTKSRYGKYRPWIFTGALPMIIGMALVVWLGSLGSSGSASGTEPNERLGFSLLALITAVIYIISTIITLKNLPPEQQSRMQGRVFTIGSDGP